MNNKCLFNNTEGGIEMSKLEYFLKPIEEREVLEIEVSNRFRGADGKPATIKVKSITQAQNNSLIKNCTTVTKGKNGQHTESLDRQKYVTELILSCVIEPNFRDASFVQAMGVASPKDALEKLFLPGEYAKISEAVLTVMGMGDLVEEAKNS